MNDDKSLTATVVTTLYQREKLADKIQILIPQKYGDLNLIEFTALLKYVDQANVPHVEILQKDKDLYKEHIRYVLPVDTNLTQYAGDIAIRITLQKNDMEVRKTYVVHTGELIINISPLKDYYTFVPDESLEFVDQIVADLQNKIEALDKVADTYDKTKADNIQIKNGNEIQLLSNKVPIGDKITVTNGGSGAPASQQKVIGESTYIPYAKPTRNGYTFLGWSTSKYTSTADYQPGQAYAPYGDMTFYAVWEQNVVKTWTITYNANGGENAPSPQTANVGQSITITYSKPTRTGYTFLGWSTWSGATEPESIFTPGYSYKSDFNLTLYAVWEKQEEDRYTISFDLQGGSGEFNPLKGKYGEAWYLPNRAPYKSGYIFKGWTTSPDGNPEYQPDDIYTIYGNATLYAVWKEKEKPKFTFSKSYDCIPYGIGAVEELVMNATVENPENLKIYYKICFVDDADGTVNDYATNSNGLTNMIETGIASANLTVQPDILIQSIKNCNNEQSFKIVICSNYDNNFDISNTAINKEIISIRLYYNKPVIQSLDVSHAPYNGAQLVGVVKFSDNFISIASSGNGESVYTDNKPMELGGDYSIDNRFDVDGENTLRYVFNFNVNKISDANHTFKLVIDDGFFKTEQTVNLGRLSSDENIYIYQDGTIEANGFLLLDSFKYDNEDVILFEPGGFVSAKSFEKISDGICFCPKVLEAFGHTQRTGD